MLLFNREKDRKTAIEIYNAAYSTRPGSLSNRQYYVALRTAIVREIEETGYCELLDQLIEQFVTTYQMDGITYFLLYDIADAYESGEMSDVMNDSRYKIILPHFPKFTWNAFVEPKALTFTDQRAKMEGVEVIRQARSVVRKAHVRMAEQKGSAADTAPAEKVQEDARETVDEAQIRSQLAAELEPQIETSLRPRIEAELRPRIEASLRPRIEAELRPSIEEQVRESMRMSVIREATAEAERQALNIVAEAKERADQIRKEARDSASGLTRKYLEDEQRRLQAEIKHSQESVSDAYFANSKRCDTVHDEMCHEVDSIQGNWLEELDKAIEDIRISKAELCASIQKWRTSLYITDLRPLTDVYCDMYRTLNVDKYIREEILFETGNGQNAAAAASPVVIEGLHKLNRTLKICLTKYEQALNRLDVSVVVPNPGDAFDESLHESYDGEIPGPEARITGCYQPGFIKKAEDEDDDEILSKAVVMIDTEK